MHHGQCVQIIMHLFFKSLVLINVMYRFLFDLFVEDITNGVCDHPNEFTAIDTLKKIVETLNVYIKHRVPK